MQGPSYPVSQPREAVEYCLRSLRIALGAKTNEIQPETIAASTF